jgi:sec-independent protein translocase protein TatC
MSTPDELDDTRAPLLDHLIELRKRLLWCILSLGITFAVCLYFARPIFLPRPPAGAGRAGQDRLHADFRGVLRRGEGRLLRGR